MGTGVGWSATTPLWYTLQVSNKFVHVGIEKEIEYLLDISDTKRNLLKKHIAGRKEAEKELERKKLKIRKRIPEVRHDIYLTEEECSLITKSPFNLQRYIAYYKRLWETLQENNCPYQGVADFCIFSFVALASMFSGMVHSEFGWTFMVSISSLVIVLISFALVFGRPTLKEKR